jgi:hypothetical protein
LFRINLHRAKLYTRCQNLMMDVFIDCYCNAKLERLVISGNPRKEIIEAAWEEIFTDYCDLIGDKKNLEAAKELSWLECKLRTISYCLYLLKITHSVRCVEIIQEFGYRQKFNYEDQVQYHKDIAAVKLAMGSVKIAIRSAAQEYKDQQTTGKKLTEPDFYELLSVLGKNNNHSMHAKDTTVYEFGCAYKLFKNEIESQKK